MRAKALAVRRSLGAATIGELSVAVQKRAIALDLYQESGTIASYVATPDEVQTSLLIQTSLAGGKRVLVPFTDRRSKTLIFSHITDISSLRPGSYGILEPRDESVRPVPLSEADLVFVPVVAWDDRGNRLGHGEGYFDRALSKRGKATAVGLAFEAQRVTAIPSMASDVALDTVVTDKRVLQFRGSTG